MGTALHRTQPPEAGSTLTNAALRKKRERAAAQTFARDTLAYGDGLLDIVGFAAEANEPPERQRRATIPAASTWYDELIVSAKDIADAM